MKSLEPRTSPNGMPTAADSVRPNAQERRVAPRSFQNSRLTHKSRIARPTNRGDATDASDTSPVDDASCQSSNRARTAVHCIGTSHGLSLEPGIQVGIGALQPPHMRIPGQIEKRAVIAPSSDDLRIGDFRPTPTRGGDVQARRLFQLQSIYRYAFERAADHDGPMIAHQ